jgi:hypothetical protein
MQVVNISLWDYAQIFDMIYLLTVIRLPPGGSSTVHIYTQTIHRTTQDKQYKEQHKNSGRVRAVPRLGELYPGICLTTEEIARKTLSQGSWTIGWWPKNWNCRDWNILEFFIFTCIRVQTYCAFNWSWKCELFINVRNECYAERDTVLCKNRKGIDQTENGVQWRALVLTLLNFLFVVP